MKNKLKLLFEQVYKTSENLSYFFSPGRVNLIGEHTDYNGGHVFPCTISLGTYGAAKKRNDHKFRFYSENFSELGIIEIDPDHLVFDQNHNWVNYAKGVILQFMKKNHVLETGFDLVIYGNIPGGGLSSSSSLELLVCVLIKELYQFDIEMLDMVKMSKAVENEYIGVNSGIMDQFIIGMGKENHSILLDTNTLEYKHVPLELDGHVILIGNTNKKRTLADSKYNERFSECHQALDILKEAVEINSLGDLSIEKFENVKHMIKDDTLMRRARHAVYENVRTLKSYDALVSGDLKTFGEYMVDSHISLRDDYEVSCFELDTMVDLLLKEEGVIGARMTGAGFGGCTVSIIREDNVEKIVKKVSKAYQDIIGYAADFHVVTVGKGAGKLDE